jgi:hypothetical protein
MVREETDSTDQIQMSQIDYLQMLSEEDQKQI